MLRGVRFWNNPKKLFFYAVLVGLVVFRVDSVLRQYFSETTHRIVGIIGTGLLFWFIESVLQTAWKKLAGKDESHTEKNM